MSIFRDREGQQIQEDKRRGKKLVSRYHCSATVYMHAACKWAGKVMFLVYL
jgi:hypothetical protein